MKTEHNYLLEKPRFYELDLLRFLAALSVVFFHYTFLNNTIVESLPAYPVLGSIFKYGYLGVELFFIISGFVILMSASNQSVRGFVISRLSRLYPAFWIAVTLSSVIIFLFGADILQVTFPQYLANLSMLGNLVSENIDPVYWTLQVELKFYFWIFVILVFNKIKYIEGLIFVWLIMSALELHYFVPSLIQGIFITEWAPFFGAGALFYRLRILSFNWKRFSLILLSYYLSLQIVIKEALEKTEIYQIPFYKTVVVTIITIIFIFFLLLAIDKTKTELFRRFTALGNLTYPLYLIHQAIGLLMFYHLSPILNKYVLLLLIVLFMIMNAAVLHYYLESSLCRKMKNYLEKAN